MNFPEYIVIGAAKCGTSSLCNYLNVHPDVYMTQPKELDFFGREGIDEKIQSYCSHFDNKNNRISGEGSVSYMLYSKLAAEQIKKFIPDVKLIVMLRNPIDRFYSDFWFNVNRGAVVYKKGLFEGVIDNTMEVPYSPVHKLSYRDSLITKGDYAFHLNNYLKYFEKDNIKIIFFEDLINDRQSVLNSVFNFLGVRDASIDAPSKIYNKTRYPGKLNSVYVLWKHLKPYLPKDLIVNNRQKLVKLKELFFSEKKPEFSPEARKKLASIYLDSINELELLVERDLSHWKT